MQEPLDFDNPWKEAIHLLFRDFLAFYFPTLHDLVDWTREPEFLDRELQQLVRESEASDKHVDQLVKVWLQSGEEAFILIHIEVQAQRDEEFSHRMMIYHCRIFDKYNRPVVSLAVLADESPSWRPDHHEVAFGGCKHRLDFPSVKLLDYSAREAELLDDSNPFAWLTLAHLKTQRTRGLVEDREVWKIRLLKGLYQRGWIREQIRLVFRLIDWLMRLPKQVEDRVWRELANFEQEKKMPFVLNAERIGREQGLKEGLQQARKSFVLGIDALLEVRFGTASREIVLEIEKIDDVDLLERILKQSKTVTSPEELRSLWQPAV